VWVTFVLGKLILLLGKLTAGNLKQKVFSYIPHMEQQTEFLQKVYPEYR
jgi:hypothetical protein